MGWTHKTQRRGRCRLSFEPLETRSLLSVTPVPSVIIPRSSPATPVPAQTASSSSGTPYDSITGASAARASYNVDGNGLAAAVIDTGVNYLHEALGGRFGPGAKVEAGYDFADNSPDPLATTWQHGTAVAGLIASSDPAHLGIAPGADIVALRVFGNNNQGDYNSIADALQWVIDNHDRYQITVVNLSISDGNNYTLNWFANDGGVGQRITSLIEQLDQLNIPVVSAAGNNFQGQQGMGFTAIVGDTISVTSTDASDHLASDAQRLGTAVGGALATDLAAPGEGVTAPYDGNNFVTVGGTSFATSLVSGAVILLQDIYKERFGQLPTVQQVDDWLKGGADPVVDSTTGITIGRLDIPKAASLIPGAPAPNPTPPPSPSPAPSPPQQPAPVPVVTSAPLSLEALLQSLTFTTYNVPPPSDSQQASTTPTAPVQQAVNAPSSAPVQPPLLAPETPASMAVPPLVPSTAHAQAPSTLQTPAPTPTPAKATVAPVPAQAASVVLNAHPRAVVPASHSNNLWSNILSVLFFPGWFKHAHHVSAAKKRTAPAPHSQPLGRFAAEQSVRRLKESLRVRSAVPVETKGAVTRSVLTARAPVRGQSLTLRQHRLALARFVRTRNSG